MTFWTGLIERVFGPTLDDERAAAEARGMTARGFSPQGAADEVRWNNGTNDDPAGYYPDDDDKFWRPIDDGSDPRDYPDYKASDYAADGVTPVDAISDVERTAIAMREDYYHAMTLENTPKMGPDGDYLDGVYMADNAGSNEKEDALARYVHEHPELHDKPEWSEWKTGGDEIAEGRSDVDRYDEDEEQAAHDAEQREYTDAAKDGMTADDARAWQQQRTDEAAHARGCNQDVSNCSDCSAAERETGGEVEWNAAKDRAAAEVLAGTEHIAYAEEQAHRENEQLDEARVAAAHDYADRNDVGDAIGAGDAVRYRPDGDYSASDDDPKGDVLGDDRYPVELDDYADPWTDEHGDDAGTEPGGREWQESYGDPSEDAHGNRVGYPDSDSPDDSAGDEHVDCGLACNAHQAELMDDHGSGDSDTDDPDYWDDDAPADSGSGDDSDADGDGDDR